MCLAAAKSGLGLDNRVAAVVSNALERVEQQCSDAGSDVSVVKEADGIAILSGPGTPIVDLLKVCGEFGLLEAALSNIGIGVYHIAPGCERLP